MYPKLASNRKFGKGVFIFLILGLLVFGFILYGEGFLTAGDRVVVGPKWVNQAQFAGVFTAKERGIYRRNGLDVEVKEFDVNTNQIEDLLNKKTDFALVSPEEFILSISEDKPIIAIASIYQVSPYAIASLSKEKILSPDDFEGKTLGVKGGKLEEKLYYQQLLRQAGLTEKDASLKMLGFDRKELEDLQMGGADSVGLYRTDQMYFFEQAGVKYNLLIPEQFGISNFNDVIITRKAFAEENPDIVKKFLKATIDGWNYSIDHPEEAVVYTMKHVTKEEYKDENTSFSF